MNRVIVHCDHGVLKPGPVYSMGKEIPFHFGLGASH